MNQRFGLAVAMLVLCAACSNSGSVSTPQAGTPDPATGGGSSSLVWKSYDRADEFPAAITLPAEWITLRDGIRLSVAVSLPVDAAGATVSTPLPVIVTQTGYNKSLPAIPAVNEFLVRHGYAHLSVDVRGTGNSEGQWEAFSRQEQEDYLEVIDWASKQPWSNGVVGTWGASFMGITQLFSAQWQHPAHKAEFVIVPDADAYRDIVFTGGQVNVGFIPLWLGLVTVLSAIPNEDPSSVPLILEHVESAITHFQVPTIAQSAIGANGQNYDGEYLAHALADRDRGQDQHPDLPGRRAQRHLPARRAAVVRGAQGSCHDEDPDRSLAARDRFSRRRAAARRRAGSGSPGARLVRQVPARNGHRRRHHAARDAGTTGARSAT